MQQLLCAIDKCRAVISRRFDGRLPAVVIAGDLNACPTKLSSSIVGKYPSTVYPMIKSHPAGYRSVLNDDLLAYLQQEGDAKENGEALDSINILLNIINRLEIFYLS